MNDIKLLYLALVCEAIATTWDIKLEQAMEVDRLRTKLGDEVFDIVAACADAAIELIEVTTHGGG